MKCEHCKKVMRSLIFKRRIFGGAGYFCPHCKNQVSDDEELALHFLEPERKPLLSLVGGVHLIQREGRRQK